MEICLKKSTYMIKKTLLILFIFSSVIFSQENLNNKYRLGKTFESSGKLEKAKEIFEELAYAQPNNNQYANSLNDVYIKLKDYENSIKFLSNRVKLHPNDVSLYGMLGASYYLNGNTDSAINTWDKGISVNNYSQINYTIISNAAILHRAFDIAIKYLEEGKERINNPAQLSYQLAQIYSYTMEYKKAALEYVEALNQQPSQLDYIRRRMDTYLSAYGAIDQSIEAISEIDKNDSVKELLLFLYKKNNDYEKAFEVELELEKNQNSDGARIFNFANEAYQALQLVAASKAYSYLIKNYPNSRFIPNSKVGFARTLETTLDQEWQINHNNWKPIVSVDTLGAFKYYPVIETYKSILSFVNGELANESLFRIGKIYFTKYNNIPEATKYFQEIIKNSSLSSYYGKANLELGRIFMINNDFDEAQKKIDVVISSPQSDNELKEQAKYLKALMQFYDSDFNSSLSTLGNIKADLSNDYSNNAIELEMVINVGIKDSVNLSKYAMAERMVTQYNFVKAEEIFKNLSENDNLFVLNNISRIRYAEILIAQDKFGIAIEVLKELSERKEMNIFADESFYLLAQVYELGIADYKLAITCYEKFLEQFPNSLYLEKSQKNLKNLKIKRSDNL